MHRRSFVLAAPAVLLASRRKPVLAVTIDDFAWRRIPERWRSQSADALMGALAEQRAKTMLFVAGENADDAEGKALLKRWNDAGHALANHTYEHRRYGGEEAVLPWYGEDILRCGELLKPYPRFQRFFRFPTLHEGSSTEQRDAMRAFLREHGYRNGHVTIDNSEWYYDARLRQRLEAEPAFPCERFRQPYLEHMLDRARYYDDMGRQVLGRSVPHTLLIHYSLLNTLFLGDLLKAFRAQGWGLLDAEEAFADPVFLREPNIQPAGQSLMWALAKETGRYHGRLEYPGEWEKTEKPKLDRLGL